MSRLWKVVLLLVVFLPTASLGILGCGPGEPAPQSIDVDAAATEEQAAAEREAEAAASGEAAPEGEGTLSDEGP